MPLSLTTRRRQQTSNAKWYSQQYLNQLHNQQDFSATTKNNFIRQHNTIQQPVGKQRSFVDSRLSTQPLHSTYLSRGLSIDRSHDIQQQRFFNKSLLKKQSATTTQAFNGSSNESDCLKANIKRSELLRTSRKTQTWSSTSSILKTLDKELAQLDGGVVGKCKDVKKITVKNANVHNVSGTKTKPNPLPTTNSQSSTTHSNRNPIKPEINKVNLSIVLSHTLNASKEENAFVISEPEGDESDDLSTDSGKCMNSQPQSNNDKKIVLTNATRPVVSAKQRRALYHSSRLTTNLTATNTVNPTTFNTRGLENSLNFNVSPLLEVQKRPPLVRAMSAPVRSKDETSKGAFLASKRKSRRRKFIARNISCDNGSTDVLAAKQLNLNKKVLTRSKSVAPDVITLVSLISSEGSDSEKEDTLVDTPLTTHTKSPTRRAPSLRKTGKSVSFQENYPTTLQFASKDYSHMLRRSSVTPFAQRIKTNRPPTAPPSSIFQTSYKIKNEMSEISNEKNYEEKENLTKSVNNNDSNDSKQEITSKPSEENYEYPEYVRSFKERECWKLFMKMSNKGVNITYDTILRGMLTPTEFRQLQKQRELEEAKAKESLENSGLDKSKPKDSSTAIERLKDSLLKI